ncbi:topless-related protein 2 [Vigna radiata var. radiata]|uniref:Topless-related protein 2 n=1 Tax=Vigna radiata var. radiata TaxID=3916 RepID=A0A3Q0EZY3_VIGRR|nr:topless-related protein 2 [Vigna radiata var. radiata]
MKSLNQELMFLILQYLDEENFKDTVHKLEQESGLFFNVKYFEKKVLAGEWDDVEKYLFGFTKVDDNRYSIMTFFEIRKQKYLEALDRRDRVRAVEILVNDLKVFQSFNEYLFKEITNLLTLNNFRENAQLSKYGDTKSARNILVIELKRLIEANPIFQDKLTFPSIKTSRLRTLINQSVNWQHQLCKNPMPNPNIRTLFINHSCSPTNGSPSLGAHVGPFTPSQSASHVNTLVGWTLNEIQSTSSQIPVGVASSLSAPTHQASNALGMLDYLHNDQGQLMTQMRTTQRHVEEATYNATPQQTSSILDDLPKIVVCTLQQGSTITTMDFHPSLHSLLAVGCANGDISLWEAGHQQRILSNPFKIWNISICSVLFQIDAHVGGVNDLAFSNLNKQLCIITCGDDKLIKVWDLNGKRLFNFEGHQAPVYSICPHQKENIQFMFSTSIDGKIKAWLYDNIGSRLDYDAPGQWCTRMLYSTVENRLFSCGTSKDGDCFLVEWNEREGSPKRRYFGFGKKCNGIVQFDTTKGRYLAAGEDNQIKFWDMDNVNVLFSTDAEGGLPNLPRLRFNKEGNLLAVTTSDGGFKVLSNSEGIKYFRSHQTLKAPLGTKNGTDSIPRCIERKGSFDYASHKSKVWETAEIIDPIQCRTITLTDSADPTNKVVRLIYTNSGVSLIVLGSKGIQRLWKWSRNELNPNGKATASVVPQLWEPNNGIVMINDVPNSSEAIYPCMALSKNDSYVMSACGGKISLFNIMSFKVMTTFMPPPPIPTCLAFHPKDNNIVAIGMNDSTVHIYNVRVNEVKSKLKGHHHECITGLAFSARLNILVSSGADAQLSFWSIDSWHKKKSVSIQMPNGNTLVGDTQVQFNNDQVRLLVCHESQLAIYDAFRMELIQRWVAQEWLIGSLSCATYSCNSQLVYAAFLDGNIGIFEGNTLKVKCRMASSAYLHQPTIIRQNVYPIVVAAHPDEPNQFAIGLSDGSIKVIEPRDCDTKWGNY